MPEDQQNPDASRDEDGSIVPFVPVEIPAEDLEDGPPMMPDDGDPVTLAEIAQADAEHKARRSRAGHYHINLRRAAERKRTRMELRIYRTAVMVAEEGMTITQVAQELGVSKASASVYWKAAREQCGMDYARKEEKQGIASFVFNGLRTVFDNAVEKSAEEAAYGAVALKTGEAILAMIGADPESLKDAEAEQEGVFNDLATHIKARSLALAVHQGQIDAINAKRGQPEG